MMEDQSRPVPSSFLALHADARGRLTSALAHVRARYELCEDLASQLYVTAQALHHDDGLAPSDVLAGMAQALSGPDAGLAPAEPEWVVRRLAELLGWADPGPA
jgi:hypothetical protein